MSNIQKLLLVNVDTKRKVREIYNKSEDDIKRDIEIIFEWLKKQQHLPADQDVNRIERIMLRNKFQIERTKIKLDKYYTYKGMYSEYFANVDPTCATFQAVRKSVIWVPMPKLLPTMQRIIAIRFIDKEGTFFNIIDLFNYILLIIDVLISHDYALSDRVIIDLSNFGLNILTKTDVNATIKGFSLYEEAFSGRISSIEYINLPPYFDVILAFVKRILSAKLISKIRTYKDIESLHKEIPKEYLPKEFGGTEQSMFDLQEKWTEELIHQKEFLAENNRKVSNESLRVGKPIHNELFGIDGTFKKLNLD